MSTLINLIGKRFYRLTVISRGNNSSCNKAQWNCFCDCGNTTLVIGQQLREGRTRSCGCLLSEMMINKQTKHGCSNRISSKALPEYTTWKSMRNRCNNHNEPAYKKYGGRGIFIDPRWDSFEQFYADMGDKPSSKHSIERIDNNGNYTPENCKWATSKEQCNNTRKNVMLTFNGEVNTLAQWSSILGIKYATLQTRITVYKWSVERAFTEPVRTHN